MIPFVAGNADMLPFRDNCFDPVACRLSLSHFTDVLLAIGEVRRVLHSGGRLIASAWGTEIDNPSYSTAVEVRDKYLQELDVPFAGTFDEGTWADLDRGCEILRSAGFEDVQIETIPLDGEFQNPAEALDQAFARPLSCYRITRLDPGEQRRLREETLSAVIEANDLHCSDNIHYYQAIYNNHQTK
jgi:SAM-dependent methyltransferase